MLGNGHAFSTYRDGGRGDADALLGSAMMERWTAAEARDELMKSPTRCEPRASRMNRIRLMPGSHARERSAGWLSEIRPSSLQEDVDGFERAPDLARCSWGHQHRLFVNTGPEGLLGEATHTKPGSWLVAAPTAVMKLYHHWAVTCPTSTTTEQRAQTHPRGDLHLLTYELRSRPGRPKRS